MPFWPNGRMGLTGVGSKLMFIVMHDRDQKHVVMVDEINRFTTLLSSWLTTSRTAARTVEEILMDQNTISKKTHDYHSDSVYFYVISPNFE